jgi:hypothetical protein
MLWQPNVLRRKAPPRSLQPRRKRPKKLQRKRLRRSQSILSVLKPVLSGITGAYKRELTRKLVRRDSLDVLATAPPVSSLLTSRIPTN